MVAVPLVAPVAEAGPPLGVSEKVVLGREGQCPGVPSDPVVAAGSVLIL